MKRKALLLLIIILISSILSCCDNRKTVIDDTVYDRECEVQNKYIEQPNAGFYVQEVGNSYIGTTELNRSLISYYDSENGISGVLCSDPSCTHDTNSCSARNHSGAVFYYDHQIYSIAQDSGSNTGNYILWKEDVSEPVSFLCRFCVPLYQMNRI